MSRLLNQLFIPVIAGKKAATYSISGNVFDGVANVADVTVALGAFSAITDASGNFTISAIPAGTSGNLTATKTGYLFTAIAIAAMTGSLTAYNFISPWWLYGGINPSVCAAAYQPLGAADLAASYVNLTGNAAYNAADGTAPTFNAATGWTFNGSSQYLKTGVIIDSYDWGFFTRFTDGLTTDVRAIAGARIGASGDKRFNIFPSLSGVTYYSNGAALAIAASSFTYGVLGLSKNHGYANGVAVAGTIGTGTAIANIENYIGGVNIDGTASYLWAGKVQAHVIYNAEITAVQALAVSTAMAALPYTAINQTYSSEIGV